jgi:hypothetical protein
LAKAQATYDLWARESSVETAPREIFLTISDILARRGRPAAEIRASPQQPI